MHQYWDRMTHGRQKREFNSNADLDFDLEKSISQTLKPDEKINVPKDKNYLIERFVCNLQNESFFVDESYVLNKIFQIKNNYFREMKNFWNFKTKDK